MARKLNSREILSPERHWWHAMKLSTQKFAILVSIGAVATGFGYVFMTNQTAQEGFAIKGLQQQIAKTQADNQKLELKSADLQALAAVQASSTQLGMVSADTFQYLAPTGGAVAAR